MELKLPAPELLAAEGIEPEDPLAVGKVLLRLLRRRLVEGFSAGLRRCLPDPHDHHDRHADQSHLSRVFHREPPASSLRPMVRREHAPRRYSRIKRHHDASGRKSSAAGLYDRPIGRTLRRKTRNHSLLRADRRACRAASNPARAQGLYLRGCENLYVSAARPGGRVYAGAGSDPAQSQSRRGLLRRVRNMASEHLEAMRLKIAQLVRLSERLQCAMSQCSTEPGGRCPVIEMLDCGPHGDRREYGSSTGLQQPNAAELNEPQPPRISR